MKISTVGVLPQRANQLLVMTAVFALGIQWQAVQKILLRGLEATFSRYSTLLLRNVLVQVVQIKFGQKTHLLPLVYVPIFLIITKQ